MASDVEIANRALQKLGAERIVALTEDSVNGRAVNSSYATLRQAELRRHRWGFAIERAELAASATAPLFGKQNKFPLPSDFLRLINPDPPQQFSYNNTVSGGQTYNTNFLDRVIEGRFIVTDDTAPLRIRYIKDVTDPNQMDILFREAFAMRIAYELAEELTQSNSKKEEAFFAYREAISEAKRANAIENDSQRPPEDPWVTVRL